MLKWFNLASTSNFLQITFNLTNPLQVPQNTLLKLLQLNLYWEGSVTQVHSNTHKPLFGPIKAFHMAASTLRKLSHLTESSTTFNYFTWRVKCKNPFSKLIPAPLWETAPPAPFFRLSGQSHVYGWSRVIAFQNGGLTSYISPFRLRVLQWSRHLFNYRKNKKTMNEKFLILLIWNWIYIDHRKITWLWS